MPPWIAITVSAEEGCEMFVTTDDRDLLRPECVTDLEPYINIRNADEALDGPR